MLTRDGSMPQRRQCGASVNYFRMLELDPTFREAQIKLEQVTARGTARVAARVKPITISVVVHVVYKKASENISDAQIQSQINALNLDFRAKNSDAHNTPSVWKALIADTNIDFAFATLDPSGNPTTGITRTQTDKLNFSGNDKVKFSTDGGIDAWPTDRYLNIWVCNLAGYLGYAQFPGGDPRTDGVVILHSAFGTTGTATAPFNLGRTVTHEIGHWLNLRHIWGDTNDCSGDDLVSDTPNAQLPNYGTPAFPHPSCNNLPDGDMFMNYMDYVDDGAMFMFTKGQVARMEAAIITYRSGFL